MHTTKRGEIFTAVQSHSTSEISSEKWERCRNRVHQVCRCYFSSADDGLRSLNGQKTRRNRIYLPCDEEGNITVLMCLGQAGLRKQDGCLQKTREPFARLHSFTLGSRLFIQQSQVRAVGAGSLAPCALAAQSCSKSLPQRACDSVTRAGVVLREFILPPVQSQALKKQLAVHLKSN